MCKQFLKNAVETANKQRSTNNKWHGKLYLPIIALCFVVLTSINIFAQPGDPQYKNPFDQGKTLDLQNKETRNSRMPDLPCNTADCNNIIAPWKGPVYCDGDFSISYSGPFIEQPIDNAGNPLTTISTSIRQVCFYWRINCNGILEIQPSQVIFGNGLDDINQTLNNGHIPAEYNIPIAVIMEQVFEKILRQGSSDNSNFEGKKNNTATQFIKTSIGSCWAVQRIIKPIPGYTPRPPDVGTLSISIGQNGFMPGESFPAPPEGYYYEYYSAPCNGVSCCSELFDVSWNSDGNANMTSKHLYKNEGCGNNDLKMDVKDINGQIVAYQVDCQPVCDWNNFVFDITTSIGIIASTYIENNTINVKILNYNDNIKEIDYIITDIYGNEFLNMSSTLSKKLVLKSNKLPNGNYHIGLFDKNKKLLLNYNINISGD